MRCGWCDRLVADPRYRLGEYGVCSPQCGAELLHDAIEQRKEWGLYRSTPSRFECLGGRWDGMVLDEDQGPEFRIGILGRPGVYDVYTRVPGRYDRYRHEGTFQGSALTRRGKQ